MDKKLRKVITHLDSREIACTLQEMIHDMKVTIRYCDDRYKLEWRMSRSMLEYIRWNINNAFRKVWYFAPQSRNIMLYGVEVTTVFDDRPGESYEVTLVAVDTYYVAADSYHRHYWLDDARSISSVASKFLVSNEEVSNLISFNVANSIKEVIYNEPATIVLWNDGTKTVVKCGENDTYDAEKGLAMCIVKKITGNKGNYNNIFRQWLPEEDDEDSV